MGMGTQHILLSIYGVWTIGYFGIEKIFAQRMDEPNYGYLGKFVW